MNKNAEEVARLKEKWSRPMSEAEIAFLRDVQGFIEGAIRNGLTFPQVIACLLHDTNKIGQNGFDYEKARADGFVPKVPRYSKLATEEFGESEEDAPPD